MNNRRTSLPTAALLVALLAGSGCASMNNTERGAVIGAAAGAAVGAAAGKATDNTARGAIIGAAVGATAGVIIGREMDAQEDRLRAELEGAKVERTDDDRLILTFDSGIFFDFDSSVLRTGARENLNTLSGVLAEHPGYNVVITGHTDSRGRADYNMALSERRARAAGDYLAGRGIAPSRMIIQGKGMQQPVASNDTEAGRQMNRRVEVVIQASDAYRRELESRSGER
jgi:outer membrane protein OmpA-like peptidoglycan-associated protein